jgi:hypothetical protein
MFRAPRELTEDEEKTEENGDRRSTTRSFSGRALDDPRVSS